MTDIEYARLPAGVAAKMTDIELTAVQDARGRELGWLLGAARYCDVWQEPDGTSVLTDRDYFGLSDPIGEVTEECRIAEAAGLLRAEPLRHGPGAIWRLTEAGEQWLAQFAEEKR